MESSALLLFVLLPLASADTGGLSDKALFFPKATDSSYVTLTPLKPLSLDAFTLCMRLSVDPEVVNQQQRETILFAYRTESHDELNVWQEKGRISFCLRSSSDCAAYSIPMLSVFPTTLCLTWESHTGLAAFWVDGRRSTLQVYRKGHRVQSGGKVILGQDPDSFLGQFNENQSFVGEISDVNMWDSVLTGKQIRHLSEKQSMELTANVLNWSSMQFNIVGNVIVVPEKYF
ncbi:C-reactive protein-like [Salminus brasiliensis]|uniref:C-reactive protein-like n=1 Tax=Salminus brasiliensis TaxID=930266 RepID=UPI003B8367EA